MMQNDKKVRIVVFVMAALLFADGLSARDSYDREEAYKRNYRSLFDTETVVYDDNDPELSSLMHKFVYGDVFECGSLDVRVREMVTCVSLTAIQALPQLRVHTVAASNAGVTPLELREALYQCAPFIGFPRVQNALEVVNEIFIERGIVLPLEKQARIVEEQRHEEGSRIQQPLYGDEIKEAFANLPDGMGEKVADLLTEVCFGDFYTRGTLDVEMRELLSLCVLVTMSAERQVAAHVHGCLKAGLDKATLCAAVIQIIPYAGFPPVLNALRTIDAVSE